MERPVLAPLAKTGIERVRPHMLGSDTGEHRPAWAYLDSNESAFGPSPKAKEAARAAFSCIERYLEAPDRFLATAIARRFELDPGRITVGQGSDDLLARLARAYLGPGNELLRSANGYLKVPNYAYSNGADVISVPDEKFKASVDNLIAALTERTRIVYVANPENPAGTYLTGTELRRLHAALPPHVLLVLDCAYEEYVNAPDYEPGNRMAEEFSNVVMCRTFSKIFGLAGARVGWCYGPSEVIDVVRRIALTFPISSPSMAAAIAALEDRAHSNFVRTENGRGRNWLTRQVEALGLSVVPSQANFVLIHFENPGRPAIAAARHLRERGIVVRRVASPAFNDYIRVTVGMQHQLEAAVDGLAEFMEGLA